MHCIGPDIKVTMSAVDTKCLHPKNVQSNPAAGRRGPTQSGQGAVLALPGTQLLYQPPPAQTETIND